jgi:hypothetical protein
MATRLASFKWLIVSGGSKAVRADLPSKRRRLGSDTLLETTVTEEA